jgi:hypothetical protein
LDQIHQIIGSTIATYTYITRYGDGTNDGTPAKIDTRMEASTKTMQEKMDASIKTMKEMMSKMKEKSKRT